MNVLINQTSEEYKNKNIPVFDYTKLNAINMCPRWGLIRYDQHKRMPGEGRSTALEMGSAAHDGFAAVRLFELLEWGREKYGDLLPDERIHSFGVKLFGQERFLSLLNIHNSSDDLRRRVNAFAIHACDTSGFYDDPKDKRRTLSNLQTSIVAYIDKLSLGTKLPLVTEDMIGIEVPFDIILDFFIGDELHCIRYIGRVDAVVLSDNGPEIEENKTASRLDDSWQDSFITSHQVTGYCIAMSTILKQRVDRVTIRGMMVPLPKTYDLGGVVNLQVFRDSYRIAEWMRWILATYSNLYIPYHKDPLFAPEFTHSCNRYFRSCSFIPLCAMASPEERVETFQQMEHDEWSPLHERNN